MEAYLAYLEEWLAETLVRRKADGFVLGVSGGVDSALMTYLLARKFKQNTLGLILPCKSSPDDERDALLVLDGAGVDYRTIDLTAAHEALFPAITEFTNNNTMESTRVIDGNMRARLRMTMLFAVAQSKNYLVVGTDNAIEWYTGYFTKFGDGAADITPFIHLLKSDIYEAAELLGVPQPIIDKAPSAGLWEGQTDESEMGVSYETLETFLRGGTVSPEARERIAFWHDRSEHKREMAWAPKKYHNE